MLHENEIASVVVREALGIHERFGPGMLESVYEQLLMVGLQDLGFGVEQQVPVSFEYRNRQFSNAYRMDLVVEKKVLIEMKAIELLAPVHSKQVITYLKLSGLKLGLLINFNEAVLRNGLRRLVNGL